MQVPVACFSNLVLTFFKHFVCLVFFIIFWFFFKVKSGVFLHNRVATLVDALVTRCTATKLEQWFHSKVFFIWICCVCISSCVLVVFQSYLVLFMNELNVINYTILCSCNCNYDFVYLHLQFAKNST